MNRHLGAWVVLACLVRPSALAAQVTPDGQLRGTVQDSTNAVIVDAIVIIASPQLIGGPRTVSIGADGQWRLVALPSGDYTVSVSASGFKADVHDGVRLAPGATIVVDSQLEIATLAEATHVEASRPVVDVASAAVVFNLDEAFLRGLPTSRNVADLINLAPGVAGNQAFGGTKLSNGLYIDGLDTTEPSEQNPWLRFNQNWLQQVQVVGLGAEAEYGLSTGVTAAAIVRSGANHFAGMGEWWVMPSRWVGVNTRELSLQLQRQFTSARVDSFWNGNGQVGGPVRADRLWFFAGLEHTTNDGAPAGYNGDDTQEEDDNRAIGKLTLNAWRSARLEGFLQGGRRHIRNFELSAIKPSEAAGDYRQPQLSGTLRATQSLGRSLLFDIQYSGYQSPEIEEPQAPGSRAGPPGHYDALSNQFSVNLLSYGKADRWRHTIKGAGTWYGVIGGSSHDVKFGTELERAREEGSSGYPGGRYYEDLGTEPSLVYLRDDSFSRGDTARLTLYVQDRLHLGRRVTLSPGLRIERFHWSTAAARDVLATTPVSPRFGIAWDVGPSHRTVVRAHVGRYTDPAFAQPILLTDNAHQSVQIVARVVAPGVFEEIARQEFASSRFIDSHVDHSYVDQFVGGVEHQLMDGLSVTGHYIQREFRDFMAYVPLNVAWVPVERRDPGADAVQGTADDGAIVTVYSREPTGPAGSVYTNLGDINRRYRGGQFVARTTGAGPLKLQASYTRSQTRGTISTALHVNAGVRFQGHTNPNRLINGDSVTGFDPTNEVKVLSVWTPPQWGGFVVSSVYRYLTGGAWGRTFVATGLTQGNETIRVEPRGTRRLPAINQLDLHVEKTVRFGGRTLGGYADVFNVWNQGVPESEWPDPVNSTSGPNLGVPFLWRPPRQVRLGLQLTF